MSLETAHIYQLLIGIILGLPIYSIIVILLFRTNLIYTSRNKDGTIKKSIPISGLLTSLSLLLGVIFLQLFINIFGTILLQRSISWWRLFIVDYLLFIILFIFDTAIIDYLVIVKWRPNFLRLPESMNSESMKVHIKASIPIGIIFGLCITILSIIISVLIA